MSEERPDIEGANDRPADESTNDSRPAPPAPDATAALLRLLVGGAVEGTDRVRRRLSSAESRPGGDLSGEPVESAADRARHALIGFLFEAYGGAVRGVSAVGRVTTSVGRLWWAVLEPVARNPLLSPVRKPFELLLDRGAARVERWIRVGKAEEQQGRDLARQLTRVPIDDVVAYLRENPELQALVKRQAQALIEELPDDPSVQSLVRSQADQYIDHLRENPQPIQELVQGQSVGLLGQVADIVREQAVTADSLLERFVRTAFRRGPRESLPAPSAAVQARATPGKLVTTASAASLQGQFAGYASRLAAFLVDSVVIGATTLLATWAAVSLLGEIGIEIRDCGAVDTRYVVRAWLCRILFLAAPLAGTAFIVAYNLIFWATTGQTPGKAVMGVRIVRLNGCPMSLLTAVRRQVGYLLSLASGGLGFHVILADDRRQGWHDKLAGTCVIYSWEARQNERLLERLRRGPRRQSNRHSS